jgi:hypothetical protein
MHQLRSLPELHWGAVLTQVTDSGDIGQPGSGVNSQPGATVTLSNTTITRNGTGIFNNGGVTQSFQENRLYGNAIDGSFSSTIGKQ